MKKTSKLNGENPLVTVLMTVKNGEKLVRESIDSILGQTFEDFEFIIIDDGSTDTTFEILKSYSDPRIRIYTQENQGVGSASARGISLARGRYIARQDHDDISLPTRLFEQVLFMEKNPKVGLLGTCAEIWDEHGPTGRYHDHPTDPGILAFNLLFNNPFVHTSWMFRREVVDVVGTYRKDYQFLEDYDFVARVSQRYLVANLDKRLVIYRETPSSLSSGLRNAGSNMAFHCRLREISERILISLTNLPFPLLSNFCSIAHGAKHTSLSNSEFFSLVDVFNQYKKHFTNKFNSETFELNANNQLENFIFTYYRNIIFNPESPTVSVLMAVKNGEKLVRESIDSILGQTFEDFEFIIIDDGSTDTTFEILKSYSDPRIRIYTQENQGLSKSLNRGISLARGRYIARQDHDDISLPTRLFEQVLFMEKNPKVGLLGTCAEIWDEHGPTGRYHDHPTDPGILAFNLLFNNPFVHTSWMFRREVVDVVGTYTNDLEREPPEDYEFVSRISRKYLVANLPRRLVVYREMPGSLSSVLRPEQELGRKKFISKLALFSSENLAYAAGLKEVNQVAINFGSLTHSIFDRYSDAIDFIEMRRLLKLASVNIQSRSNDKRVSNVFKSLASNLEYQYYLHEAKNMNTSWSLGRLWAFRFRRLIANPYSYSKVLLSKLKNKFFLPIIHKIRSKYISGIIRLKKIFTKYKKFDS